MLACIEAPSGDRQVLEGLLEGVTTANHILLSRGGFPLLYRSGVRYRREPTERWLLVPGILRRGWDDCEGLASWRAAELRIYGVPARVGIVPGRAAKWHAVVVLPEGGIEDPSRKLGM
jgi:hypothetical protein